MADAPSRVEIARLAPKANVYDFRRPDKFSKEQIRTVQNMHETFARLATTTLSASVRALVGVHVASVDQMTFEEFIRSIPSPTTLAVVDMDPLKGFAVLEIDPAITFAIIERLLGGRGESVGLVREHTDIEHSVLEGIIVRMLGNLREAWSAMLDLRPRLSQIETNPQFAQIVPPSEMIVLVTLETTIGDAHAMINLAFPYMTIEPIIPKLSAQYWYSAIRRPSSREGAQALHGHMAGLDVTAEVLVEGEKLSLRELGALKRGKLVQLPGEEKGEALFRMGGHSLFGMEALPRKRGKVRGYRVLRPAAPLPLLEPEKTKDENLEFYAGLRNAMEEFRTGIASTLTGIANGIAALREKQDAMEDQLALAPSEREAPERAGTREHKRPFDFIRQADPDHLLNFIQGEHPQTLALVLSYLEPQTASRILERLPVELQPDVARRIAWMDRTMPEVVREVERVLEKKLSTLASEEYAVAGGVDSIVEILNLADRSTERRIVESLGKEDRALAEDIRKKMFVFEDIVTLERGAVEKLVMRLDVEIFLRAMKAAPEELKNLIWGCIPKGELAGRKARFDELGKVRLSEVDAAQQKIVAAIREMEESGEIVIARPDETLE